MPFHYSHNSISYLDSLQSSSSYSFYVTHYELTNHLRNISTSISFRNYGNQDPVQNFLPLHCKSSNVKIKSRSDNECDNDYNENGSHLSAPQSNDEASLYVQSEGGSHSETNAYEDDSANDDYITSLLETDTLKGMLPSLNIKKDIDSIMICSSKPFPLISSIDSDAVCIMFSSISRLKSSNSSRFNVKLEDDTAIRFRGSKVRSLCLGSFPNITLAKFIINNHIFLFNMYWLNPEFIPKSPLFEDGLLLTIIASLNYARLSCANNIYEFDGSEIPSNVRNDGMKHYVRQVAFNCIPIFSLDNKNRKIRDQPIEWKTATVFFGEMYRCFEALSIGEYSGHTLKDLLPYDYDNALFSEEIDDDNLGMLGSNALKLVNSVTFTLTVSNIKSICTTEYFHTNMKTPPIPDNDIFKKFEKYEKACDKLLSNLMQKFLTKDPISDEVHVYYDYGMEANLTDSNVSLLISLSGGFKDIGNIIHGHNSIDEIQLTEEKLIELAESMLQDPEGTEQVRPENVAEYLSWFAGMQKRKYRTFFMNNAGNWHSGSNRVKRVHNEGKTEIEHRSSSGMCSAQGYSPQSRIIQNKTTRKAVKFIDGLPNAILTLLRQKDWKQPQGAFTTMLNNVLIHLKEIDDNANNMKNNQLSVRYECLMKMCTKTKKVSFPQGFMEMPIFKVNTDDIAKFYSERVNESTQSILSLFPKIGDKNPQYNQLSLFSAEAKTMIILHCELLAYEFGLLHKRGTIMREMNQLFKKQGFTGLSQESRYRLPLNENDLRFTKVIKNGLSPSFLPFSLVTSLQEVSRGIIDVSCVNIPTSYASLTSTPMLGVALSSNIPVTYEKHLHLSTSMLHMFLEPNDENNGEFFLKQLYYKIYIVAFFLISCLYI